MNHGAILRELAGLGEKKLGSPEAGRARELIDAVMQGIGTDDCSRTEEAFTASVCCDCHAEIVAGTERVPCTLLDYTGGAMSDVAGRLVDVGYGSWTEFTVRRCSGAIAVCRSNLLNHRVLQVARANAAGAVGVIVVSPHDTYYCRGVGAPGKGAHSPIPAVSVSGAGWRQLQKTRGDVRIMTQCDLREERGVNLVYDLGSGNGTGQRVFGAHYDSWEDGAHDNGSGVVMLLSMAERLVQSGQQSRSRVIFFDGEELGMLGSRWHVSHNDVADCEMYVNLEMPVPVKSGRLRTVFFSRKTLRRVSLAAKLLSIGYWPVPLELFYACGNEAFPSDIDPFYRAGVPCLTTFCSGAYTHTAADVPGDVRTELFESVGDVLLGLATVAREG